MQPLLLTLLLSLPALSAPVRLGWDMQVADRWEVWRGIEKLATVTTNEATFDLPADTISIVHVVAVSEFGIKSESTSITLQPFRVHHTADMLSWKPGPVGFREYSPRAFFRVQYITPTE